MRIVTNPGSNLDEDLTHALDVDLVPQKIVVDGISHDTRNTIDFGQVDAWFKRSRQLLVTGTTEPEFVDYFTRLIQRTKDPEVLCVMTSRKMIGSHDAAVAAVKKLKDSPDALVRSARIEVVDTLLTDVGAGLMTVAAVQARKAGLSLTDAANAVRKLAERNRSVFTVATLDHMIRGGRVSGVQGFLANFLNIRPVLAVVDGQPQSIGRMSSKADPVDKILETLSDKIDRKTPVWLGVAHGNVPDRAKALTQRLKETFACEYMMDRPLSTSIYVHLGPGALVVMALPLDGLAWRPPKP